MYNADEDMNEQAPCHDTCLILNHFLFEFAGKRMWIVPVSSEEMLLPIQFGLMTHDDADD